MADYYCDHGNTTLYPTAYMATPSGPSQLPQDGDGKASGTGSAPASASASLDFSGSTAAAGATITVMGATLTCVASGAGTTQFNAGSGATLAGSLATAINAATAAVTVANGNISNPYLKAMVWASASGATLNIYCRIASADLNQSSNASCTVSFGATANWTSQPATTNFSGGVSGPWRYWANETALAAAVSAGNAGGVAQIGAFRASVMGAPTGGDIVNIRSRRAGADIVVQMSAGFDGTTTRTAGITQKLPLIFRVDDGTLWSDGNSNGTFTLRKDAAVTGNQIYGFSGTANVKYVLQGKRLSDTTCNFKFDHQGVNNGSGYQLACYATSAAASFVVFDAVEFADTATGNVALNLAATGYKSSAFPMQEPGAFFKNCVFKTPRAAAWVAQGDISYLQYHRFEKCRFDYTGLGSANTKSVASYFALQYHLMEFVGCKWVLPSGANKTGLNGNGANASGQFKAVFVDCDFGNLIALGGDLVGSTDQGGTHLREMIVQSDFPPKAFVHETQNFLIEWRNSSYPCRNAVFPGNTKTVMRMSVTGEANKVMKECPAKSARMVATNENADGTYTLKVGLLVDANFISALGRSPRSDEISLLINYTDVSGALQTVETRPRIGVAGTTLASGTAAEWTTTSADINGVPHSFTPFEIAVSLPNVKQYAAISCWLLLGIQTSSSSDCLFIDPEFSLT